MADEHSDVFEEQPRKLFTEPPLEPIAEPSAPIRNVKLMKTASTMAALGGGLTVLIILLALAY